MLGAYSVVLEVVSVLGVHKPASTLMARVFTAGALYSFFFISVKLFVCPKSPTGVIVI